MNILLVSVVTCIVQAVRVYAMPECFLGVDFIRLTEMNPWLSGVTVVFAWLNVVVSFLLIALFLWGCCRILYSSEPLGTPTFSRFLYATLCAEWTSLVMGALLIILYACGVPADIRASADSLLYFFDIDRFDLWMQVPLRALSLTTLVYIAALVFSIHRTVQYTFRQSVDLTLCAYVVPNFVLTLLSMMVAMMQGV